MIYAGERVAAIHDLKNIDAPLTFTLSNGVLYQQTGDKVTEIIKQ